MRRYARRLRARRSLFHDLIADVLTELVQIYSQLVGFAVSQQLVPGDFAFLIAGHAAQHAAQGGLDAGGYLIVRLAGGDAVDEGALLIPIGELQVVREAAVGGEFDRAGGVH